MAEVVVQLNSSGLLALTPATEPTNASQKRSQGRRQKQKSDAGNDRSEVSGCIFSGCGLSREQATTMARAAVDRYSAQAAQNATVLSKT